MTALDARTTAQTVDDRLDSSDDATPEAPADLLTRDGRPASALFSLDPDQLHLNHASFGSPPQAATRVQEELRRQMLASPIGWFPAVPERVAAARDQLAPWLGVHPGDLAMVANASAAATVVLAAVLDGRTGAEVVVTDHGYGAVTMAAERWVRRVGGRVVTAHVPLDADAATAHDAILEQVSQRTALVLIDQITSPTARALPVGDLARSLRQRGVPLAVDAAHVPLQVPGGVEDAAADFWFANLHKFACAPAGAAILVANGERAQALYPVIDSWGAELPYPERFDHQGTLDLTAWLAAPTALQSIEDDLGWDRVRRHVRAMADHGAGVVAAAMSAATDTDCTVEVGMPVAATRLVALPPGLVTTNDAANAMRDTLLRAIDAEVAVTSFAGRGYLRLSTHAYTTAADYEAFAERAVPFLVDLARRARP